MLQNFTQVNNFPPQVSSCNPSVVSYMCACCCLFLCRMLCLLFLFFLFGAVCSEEGYEIGVRMKKKTPRMVICEKKTSRDGQKKLFLGKKWSRQNPEREPPSFQGEPPKFNTLVFVED